jgi:hypothetical protein
MAYKAWQPEKQRSAAGIITGIIISMMGYVIAALLFNLLLFLAGVPLWLVIPLALFMVPASIVHAARY